jgi:rhodanese-related sulfurtransferase
LSLPAACLPQIEEVIEMLQQKSKWIFLPVLVFVVLVLGACNTQTTASVQTVAVNAAGPLELPVEIDPATVDQIRHRDDVVLLDVREDFEYEAGHIPGATLIPLGQISSRLAEIPTDKTVVAVCRSGNRSEQASNFLRQQGFDNVHNMQGGMNAWGQAGYEIEK